MTTLATPANSAVDPKTFWKTIGERATGTTVVTAESDCGPTGFLGLSATHITADPPTMLVSIDHKTSALAGILARKHFAINFLPADAELVAHAFSGRAGLSGAARFFDGEWTTLVTGAPVYRQALGVFDCELLEVVERGNISIVIGHVVGSTARGEGAPLIYFRGKTYKSLNAAD
ncbi:flavin reductase family protein [Rhizobium ruizarguesonis]|uniref:flavin reductase family protein n=1 Tax=Rhizobium ruizarguesonis TaxID=2081791 RepID=UPI00103159A1|nr:flavin reductase family protein [Rhizobium ruizarguesonis]TAT96071.1 flavin reductase [Rhizobium ruizarguesonis]